MSRDLSATRDFFGPRAAGWDEKFPDDGPVYARAVAALVQAVVMRPLRRLLGGRRSAVRPGGAH